ncbi:MAG: hypothetical protein QOG52_2502 [Frankiaceae bacterium]|jgi:hypothetical protein|nr:hypothetical protein [Frankiaceae bacterium]
MLRGVHLYAVINKTATPCLLDGPSRIVSSLADGTPVALADVNPQDQDGHPMSFGGAPLTVGSHGRVGLYVLTHSGAALDNYHCPDRPGSTDLALADGSRLRLWDGAACRQDNHWASPFFALDANPVWAVSNSLPLQPVNARAGGVTEMHATAAPTGPLTGGRADIDGDGAPDDVVVDSRGAVTVTLTTGETYGLPFVPDTTVRLASLPDLFGDGHHEILVASSAAGCCGYRFAHYGAAVYSWQSGGLVQLTFGGGSGQLRFDDRSGLTCVDGSAVQVEVTGDKSVTIRRASYQIIQGSVVNSGVTQTPFNGTGNDPGKLGAVVSSNCPGMDAFGWAN